MRALSFVVIEIDRIAPVIRLELNQVALVADGVRDLVLAEQPSQGESSSPFSFRISTETAR